MLQNNYSKNYLRIYFWKFISILSGFLSLLIVVPHLSDNLELYGIYAFCISFTLYLMYADFGFLNSGQKFAAEAFARGNRKEEIEMLGFTGAVLLLMIIPFSIVMIYFSFYPHIILSDLTYEGEFIASKIFLILGIILPFHIILQRLVQSILIIRIKDYIALRIDVIFNLIKIASVFYFFADNKYLIVEYFLFINLLSILSSFLILSIIKKSENYNFLYLLKSIKLNRKQYNISKKLAYSSLISTLGWIIYYELDLILIGKWLGPKEVAIYAIGFTFLNFIRTLWNSVFSPFSQRFNHFIGMKKDSEMKKFIANIIDYSLPLCIIVTVILTVVAEPLAYFWVGNKYSESILIMQVLIIGTAFGFVTSPASHYFTAIKYYKYIYILAIFLPLIFIISSFIFAPKFGILGISISKSLSMFACFIISMIGLLKIHNSLKSIKKWFISLLVFSGLITFLLTRVLNIIFSNFDKSTINLIILMLVAGLFIIVSYLLILITKKKQRNDLKLLYQAILRNYKKKTL